MILRILTSASLVLLGYYIGREVGRTEPIRRELREARESDNKKPETPSSKTKPKQTAPKNPPPKNPAPKKTAP